MGELKYKIVKNFLSPEQVNLFQNYCIIRHRFNTSNFDSKQNNNSDTYFYADPLMESLMVNKLLLMEKETNLKLFPTYSFWRLYTHNAVLEKHKDRGACEISVTVMIGSDGTKWPIYMDGTELSLEAGDAVIYKGCEVEHWRNNFEGDWQAQCFLHYVDQNGPNKDQAFDQREGLGCTKKKVISNGK